MAVKLEIVVITVVDIQVYFKKVTKSYITPKRINFVTHILQIALAEPYYICTLMLFLPVTGIIRLVCISLFSFR